MVGWTSLRVESCVPLSRRGGRVDLTSRKKSPLGRVRDEVELASWRAIIAGEGIGYLLILYVAKIRSYFFKTFLLVTF